jgi:flagellar protein FlbD
MILLTRLNNKTFVLNASWIEQIEALPDTTVTLTNGKKIVVKETVTEVQTRCLTFYRETGLFRVAEQAKEGENHV